MFGCYHTDIRKLYAPSPPFGRLIYKLLMPLIILHESTTVQLLILSCIASLCFLRAPIMVVQARAVMLYYIGCYLGGHGHSSEFVLVLTYIYIYIYTCIYIYIHVYIAIWGRVFDLRPPSGRNSYIAVRCQSNWIYGIYLVS